MKLTEHKQTSLFISLDATGHINSLMGVADRLKDEHNFRTIFLVPGPTNLRTVEVHGHELRVMMKDHDGRIVVTSDADKKYTERTAMNDTMDRAQDLIVSEPLDAYLKMAGDPNGIMAMLKVNIVEKHEAVKQVLEELQPNLVVVDTWYMYPCIVNLKNIPWVSLCSASPLFYMLPKPGQDLIHPAWTGLTLWNKSKREEMRQKEPQLWRQIVEERARIRQSQLESICKNAELDKLYLDNGLKFVEPGPYGYFSPYLSIYQYAKEIDYEQEDDILEYPPRWFRSDSFIRKSVDKVNPEEAEYWKGKLNEAMKGKEAMIYFSLGTLASGVVELIQRYIDMFKTDTKRLYVMSYGFNGEALQLNSDNIIGAKYLPQTFFLQRSNLAIIHGGNNSVSECLYYGTPMIVMPCLFDQSDNAQRLDDFKLGKRLRISDTTSGQLFQSIEEILLDTDLHRRLKDISKNMQNRDDLTKIARMLKKLTLEKNLDEDYIAKCKSEDFIP